MDTWLIARGNFAHGEQEITIKQKEVADIWQLLFSVHYINYVITTQK